MDVDVRVEAVISGRLSASSRFRVLQHVGPLRSFGIDVRADPPRISKYAIVPDRRARKRVRGAVEAWALNRAKVAARVPALARSWRADVSWLEREMVPGTVTLEPLLHRPLLFDVDDAVWMLSPGHERAIRAIARRTACVLAGNDYLADWFSDVAPAVSRVWTAVDTDRFVPGAAPSSEFVVGWTGSSTSLHYLGDLSRPLARFLREAPDARLLVIADHAPVLPDVDPQRVEFVRWDPSIEATVPQRFSVGLMPLRDSPWSRGKCAFKMLQYMACGIPSVVSPIGMNAQVLDMADIGLAASSEDEWVEALLTLYADRDRARALGQNARALVEREFSIDVIAPQIAGLIRQYR